MKKIKNWDSLVWVIIGVFILSVALIWIINVLWFSKNTLVTYNNSVNKYIIESNIENIVKKLWNATIDDNNVFYLSKDTVNKEFSYLTWTTNESYKYIDKFIKKVDPVQNIWKTYKVELNKKIDILKHVIYPPEIENIVYQYDATNIDWSYNSTFLNDWDKISVWKDVSWNWLDATQTDSNKYPEFEKRWIAELPVVKFLWTSNTNWSILYPNNDNNNVLINNDDVCSNQFTFMEKSFAIVFKTWFDITRDQFIYEQWGQATWYSFSIHNWELRAWILNKAYVWPYSCFDDSSQERDNWHKFKSVKFTDLKPDTYYFITIIQDSTHEISPWVEDDVNNKLKIYLNWVLISTTNHVDPQPEHWKGALWWVNERSVRPWDETTVKNWDWQWWCDNQCLFFDGWIWELISWNHALTNNEIRWIQNYFKEKWLGATSNIKYHRVSSSVKKVN